MDDVNTTAMFSQKFEEKVYPPDVQKSNDPTKTGTSWSKPDDESINRYGTVKLMLSLLKLLLLVW